MYQNCRKFGLLFSVCLFGWLPSSQAILLDWDNVSWTAGSFTQSFDVDASNAGDDITISISGDVGAFFLGTPTVGSDLFRGGLSPKQDSLQFALDFSSQLQSITVAVDFLYASGVSDVSFSLFDVDRPSHSEQVRNVYGSLDSGPSLAATLTGSQNNSVQGSGINQTVTGTASASDNTNKGNVGVDFGSQTMNRFVFTYGSDMSSSYNPGSQGFSFHDVNFNPVVPETGTTVAGILVCAAGIFFFHRRWRLKAASHSQSFDTSQSL
jgi:hypothetical protein